MPNVHGLLLAIVLAMGTVPALGEPMTFRIASDGGTAGDSWIVADGTIEKETGANFRQFLADQNIHPGSEIEVYLNSLGGNLFAGVSLGETIREFGFGTRVARSVPLDSSSRAAFETDAPGECYSACSFAFLGGKRRVAADRSIGVHQHYSAEALRDPRALKFSALDFSAQQIANGILTEYVVRMGVDARFLVKAGLTEPQHLYRFSSAELREYRITLNDLEYSDWTLEPYREGLVALSGARGGEHHVALFCRNDRALRLSLSSKKKSPEAKADEIAAGAEVYIFGVPIPARDVSAFTERTRLRFEFKLPANLKPDPASDEGMSAVGAFRFFFYQAIPARGFSEIVNLLRKNCI